MFSACVTEPGSVAIVEIPDPVPGTYDVWANFWANPSEDWRIVAGLTGCNIM